MKIPDRCSLASHRLSLYAASITVIAAAIAGGACSASSAYRPTSTLTSAATQPPRRPAATSAPAVQVEPLTVTPEPPPTPVPERCPDPYVDGPSGAPTAAVAGATPAGTPGPVRIAHALDVPSATTPAFPASKTDAALERRITDALGPESERYAVVAQSLTDGRRIAINDRRVFYAASLFKLEVMYETLHQEAAGLISLTERYRATDYYSRYNLGPHVIELCDEVTLGDALAYMMSVSDNVAAVMLQDRAGAGNINTAMEALGLEATRLTEDGSLPATASDVARLLEAIGRGQAVNAAASARMAELMKTEELPDRIPAGLPPGTIVAHKTGNWTNATHDAGIVYGPRGAYVIVVMSDIGQGGDAAAVEAEVSRIVWDEFER